MDPQVQEGWGWPRSQEVLVAELDLELLGVLIPSPTCPMTNESSSRASLFKLLVQQKNLGTCSQTYPLRILS